MGFSLLRPLVLLRRIPRGWGVVYHDHALRVTWIAPIPLHWVLAWLRNGMLCLLHPPLPRNMPIQFRPVVNVDSEPMIRVWRWEDAPEEFRVLSRHGGDEDWVAFIPDGFLTYGYIGWMNAPPFGWPDRHKVEGGEVVIGAHA